jgi:methyl-accepting chemotaxis protein
MKNVSIRTKILAGVTLVMLVGAIVVVVYLHQSYSSGLDVDAQDAVSESVAAWEVLADVAGGRLDDIGPNPGTIEHLVKLKEITGTDYGLLMDKARLDREEYDAARSDMGLASNWDEREEYVLVAATDEAAAENMQFGVPAEQVPEIGKVVGIENGACSETCHGDVGGSGEYWGVAWSEDRHSYTHAVFPVTEEGMEPVGVVYAIADISPQADAARESLTRTLVVIGLTLLVATLVIGWMLDTLVFRRLGRMIVTMEDLSIQVAGGAFDVSFEPGDRQDEIGQFENFFARFLELVSGAFKQLHGR